MPRYEWLLRDLSEERYAVDGTNNWYAEKMSDALEEIEEQGFEIVHIESRRSPGNAYIRVIAKRELAENMRKRWFVNTDGIQGMPSAVGPFLTRSEAKDWLENEKYALEIESRWVTVEEIQDSQEDGSRFGRLSSSLDSGDLNAPA